ncbi:MAG: DNA polymerase III subunit beta [Limnochordia bacterium]|nr:DNA polymerase III subunit beta [Limnochordia bacterium]
MGRRTMNVFCKQQDLQYGVDTVEHAVSSGDSESIPGIAGILLEAKEDQLILSANDHKLGIRCSIPAVVEETGRLLVDGRYFSQVVRKLPEVDVSFAMAPEENAMVLRAGTVRLKLQVLNVQDFQGLHVPTGEPHFVAFAHDLQNMIRHTLISVGLPEDRRPFISGILVEYEDNNLNLVSTDGNRLAVCSKEVLLPEDADQGSEAYTEDVAEPTPLDSTIGLLGETEADTNNTKVKAVAPGRTMNLIARILGGLGEKGKVKCRIGQNMISFWNDRLLISARLIEGDYPDYNRFTEGLDTYPLPLPRADFLAASDRAGIMTKKGSAVMLIEAEDTKLRISSREPELGHIDEELILPFEVQSLTKECWSDNEEDQDASSGLQRLVGAYQARFFIDALRVMNTQEVILELGEANGPALLKIPNSDFFTYLVMPVKISEGEI